MELWGVKVSSDDLVNAEVVAAAVLSVLLVALGTYGRRRCCHPVVRLVVLGASTLYLLLTSSIISTVKSKTTEPACGGSNSMPAGRRQEQRDAQNMWTLLLWFVLILIIKGNADMAAAAAGSTSALPAFGGVSIDSQKISPSVGHLSQYAWLVYLIWVCFPQAGWAGLPLPERSIFIAFCALGLASTVLKLAASYSASNSFSLGKNARLISGYMEQLVADDKKKDNEDQEQQVPRYIVMGERKKYVEKNPQGYRVKTGVLEDEHSSLVTLDRVWRLAEDGDGLLAEHRDLCLSYSLFKILRRRLSGYPLADAGSGESLEFVLRGMDSVGAAVDSDRVFRVLVDELWFTSDFYYSPIPLCTLSWWCAALNCLCSVLIIAGAIGVGCIYEAKHVVVPLIPYKIITYSLLVAVVLVEAWEIVAGVCSNWAKMALLGHYLRHESAWRRCSCVHAVLAAVLRLRPARRWRDKIGQNSVLEPRRFLKRSGLLSEKLYGRAGLMRSVKVSPAVKDAVLGSLLSSFGRQSSKGSGSTAARRVGGKIDWALYGSSKTWSRDGGSNTELILVWHVATRLFEMMSTSSPSADMIAASHLSYYCAYLVAAAPELLPDCSAWTKKRYEEVSKDVRAAFGKDGHRSGSTAPERYERLVSALSADSRDTVLRRGAEIGQHLVKEYAEDEASACRILADFWSEMLLYVAPSENVKGHVQAMARGGEFVTLVWALLLHAGVTTRPEAPGDSMV